MLRHCIRTYSSVISRTRSITDRYSYQINRVVALSRNMTTRPQTIGYVTDCEGNYDYWMRYISISNVLYTEPSDQAFKPSSIDDMIHKRNSLRLKDDCQLVFGGDACDRGSGDIRLLYDLVSLKRRYPDRIHFIIGNRDSNKMRIYFELQRDPTSLHEPKVYWLRGKPMLSDSGETLSLTPSQHVKWMLEKTMGSFQSFEYRRIELQELFNRNDVSDEEVKQSYLDLIDPRYMNDDDAAKQCPYGSLLVEYLRGAKIMLTLGDTLFLHGAIHTHSLGWVPPSCVFNTEYEIPPPDDATVMKGISTLGTYTSNISDWIHRLNAFKDVEIEDYIANASKFLAKLNSPENSASQSLTYWSTVGGYQHAQPGSRLLQYGMGWLVDKSINPSVIYSSYAGHGRVTGPSENVVQALQNIGINRIIVGHQPHGDSPLVIDCGNGFKIICGDTSYSRNTLWPISQHPQSDPSQPVAMKLPYPIPTTPPIIFDDKHSIVKTPPQQSATATESEYKSLKDDQVSYLITENLSVPPIENTRGVTVSEVLIELKDNSETNVEIKGKISNGRIYSCSLSDPRIAPYIGKQTMSGWSVKSGGMDANDLFDEQTITSTNPDTYYILLSKGEGFNCKNKIISIDEIDTHMIA